MPRTYGDLLVELAEGNPGALTVCCMLMENKFDLGLHILEAMNLRGPDIWCLYKDECGEDMHEFQHRLLIEGMKISEQMSEDALEA